MKNCIKCNLQIEDDMLICPNCAAIQTEQPPISQITQQNAPQMGAEIPKIDLNKQNSQNQQCTQPPQNYNTAYTTQQFKPSNPNSPYNPNNLNNQYNPQGFMPPYQANYNETLKNPNTTGFLVWSIILCMFCQLLGIPAIVFSAIAIGKQNPIEKMSNIKIAKILCIIGTALTVFCIIAYIALMVFMFSFAANSLPRNTSSFTTSYTPY